MIKENHKREANLEVSEKENADSQRYLKLFCEVEICYSGYRIFFYLIMFHSYIFTWNWTLLQLK